MATLKAMMDIPNAGGFQNFCIFSETPSILAFMGVRCVDETMKVWHIHPTNLNQDNSPNEIIISHDKALQGQHVAFPEVPASV